MEKAMDETRFKHRRNDKAHKFLRKYAEYLNRNRPILVTDSILCGLAGWI